MNDTFLSKFTHCLSTNISQVTSLIPYITLCVILLNSWVFLMNQLYCVNMLQVLLLSLLLMIYSFIQKAQWLWKEDLPVAVFSHSYNIRSWAREKPGFQSSILDGRSLKTCMIFHCFPGTFQKTEQPGWNREVNIETCYQEALNPLCHITSMTLIFWKHTLLFVWKFLPLDSYLHGLSNIPFHEKLSWVCQPM